MVHRPWGSVPCDWIMFSQRGRFVSLMTKSYSALSNTRLHSAERMSNILHVQHKNKHIRSCLREVVVAMSNHLSPALLLYRHVSTLSPTCRVLSCWLIVVDDDQSLESGLRTFPSSVMWPLNLCWSPKFHQVFRRQRQQVWRRRWAVVPTPKKVCFLIILITIANNTVMQTHAGKVINHSFQDCN